MKKICLLFMNLIFASPMLALNVNEVNAVNGNGYLPDAMPFDKVIFLGAHNAPMAREEKWIYRQQNLKIEKLFDRNVRMIKTPIHWYKPLLMSKLKKAPPYIALCHDPDGQNNCKMTLLQRVGLPPQTAKQLFVRIAKFLKSNLKEVFILKLESFLSKKSLKNGTLDYSDEKVASLLSADLESSGLSQYAYRFSRDTITGNLIMPTLGELRLTDKRLIIVAAEGRDVGVSVKSPTLYPKDILGCPYVNAFDALFRQSDWREDNIVACGMVANDNLTSTPMFEMNVNPEFSLPKGGFEGFVVSIALKVAKAFGIVSSNFKFNDYKMINSRQSLNARLDLCQANQSDNLEANVITSDFVELGELSTVVNEMNAERAKNYSEIF